MGHSDWKLTRFMNACSQTPARLRAGALHRRGAAVIISAVVGVGAIAGVGAASGTPQLRLESDAGGNLLPAARLSLDDPPPSSTTTSTTTSTTVPTADGLQVPPPGRIAFPIDAADDCSASNNFGDPRGSSRRHEGLDIIGSQGRAVYAVATGRLTQRYDDRGLTYGAGNGWKLEDEENNVVYKFFHLDRHESGLAVGDIVEFGDIIGYVGNTGTSGVPSDTNYHLHFEYRPNNVPRDPRPLLVPHPNCNIG